jgi:hypothetical protein
VFGALLDRSAGQFRFGPTRALVPEQRSYVPGTMVLETTWQTPGGWLLVHDLLVMGRAGRQHSRERYPRAPTDFGATGVLLRTATCISGQVEVMVDCAPLFGYGAVEGAWSYRDEGYQRMTVAPQKGDLRLDLAGSIPFGTLGVRAYGRTALAEASRRTSRCPGTAAACRPAGMRRLPPSIPRSATGATG